MSDIRVRASIKYRNDSLLRAREARGMSQPDAAEFCGVPLGVYMDLEKMDFSGLRGPKSDATMMRHAEAIATAFGLALDHVAPPDLVSARAASRDYAATATVSTKALLLAAERFTDRACLPAGKELDRKEDEESLAFALSKLTKRERAAVEARFGFDGGGERNWDETGAVLRVSGERARRIVSKAIHKMQHPVVAARLAEIGE